MTYEEWAVKVVRALCKEEKDLDYYKENRKPSDAAYQALMNTSR